MRQGWDDEGAERQLPSGPFPFPREIKNEMLPVRIDRIEEKTVHGSRVTENAQGKRLTACGKKLSDPTRVFRVRAPYALHRQRLADNHSGIYSHCPFSSGKTRTGLMSIS